MALNAQNFIYSAKDFAVVFTLASGATFPVLTMKKFTSNVKLDTESIRAIGQVEPIAIQEKTKDITGTIQLQLGEFNNMLAAGGITDATDIKDAIITFIGTKIENPLPFARTYTHVYVSSEGIDITAGSAESLVDISYSSLSIK